MNDDGDDEVNGGWVNGRDRSHEWFVFDLYVHLFCMYVCRSTQNKAVIECCLQVGGSPKFICGLDQCNIEIKNPANQAEYTYLHHKAKHDNHFENTCNCFSSSQIFL